MHLQGGWKGIFWGFIAFVSMSLATRKRRWREILLGVGGDRGRWKAVLAVVASLGAVVAIWLWKTKLSTWLNMSKRRVHDATPEEGSDTSKEADPNFDDCLVGAYETPSRMANNYKGRMEKQAFEAMGFRLEFPAGTPIEETIEAYKEKRLKGNQLGPLGLVEIWFKGNPQPQLGYTTEALRSIFKVWEVGVRLNGYPGVFGAEGVLVEWAKKQSRFEDKRRGVCKAVTYLEASIKERKLYGKGDVKHDFMLGKIEECVEALKGICRTGGR